LVLDLLVITVGIGTRYQPYLGRKHSRNCGSQYMYYGQIIWWEIVDAMESNLYL